MTRPVHDGRMFTEMLRHSPRSELRHLTGHTIAAEPRVGVATITLLTSGTLGDVLPFVALGLGLRRVGVQARIAAHPTFAPLVRRHGLDYAAVEGDQTELLHAEPAALTLESGPLRGALASMRFVRRALPLYEQMLGSAWLACQGSDALVVALPTAWGVQIAEALGIPCIFAPLQPLTPTREWPSALLPLSGSLGPRLNLHSHRLVALALRLPWCGPLRRWRRDVLRLPPAKVMRNTNIVPSDAPLVYGFSPWLAPPPPDWPADHRPVGFWRLDATPPGCCRRLAAFLAHGEPPIYIGFGSMGARSPLADTRLALEAVQIAGVRAVLLGGAEAAQIAGRRRDICVVASVSHSWLLPQVAAAIHHGGAGTTGASLHAGVPAAAIPSAADQFFWGRRIARVGVGPAPVARRAISATRLAELIRETLEGAAYRRRAGALAELLRQERAVEQAVELIIAQLGSGR